MNPLTRLAVLLCVIAQAVVGCAGGGKALCISLGGCGGGVEVPATAECECDHEHDSGHGGSGIPTPVPVHDHDGDCCVDIPVDDAGRVTQVDPLKDFQHGLKAVVQIDATGLGGGSSATLTARPRAGWTQGPSNAVGLRASAGLATTRLRV